MGASRLFFEAYGKFKRLPGAGPWGSEFSKVSVRNSMAVISHPGHFLGLIPSSCLHRLTSDSGDIRKPKRLCHGKILPDKVPVSFWLC